MNSLDQARTAHAAAVETHNGLRGKASAAEGALRAAQTARAEMLKAAAAGEAVRPGDLAAAAQGVANAETDHRSWAEAASIAHDAERGAERQLRLELQVQSLLDYRTRCEQRAAMADDVAAKIQAAREALETLERLDAETAAGAPRHALTMSGQSPVAGRILPSLDRPSTRDLYNPGKMRDDFLTGVMRLPSGTDHLAEIDREIARAREVAMLDAKRRAA